MYDVIVEGLSDGKKHFMIHLTSDDGVLTDVWNDFLLLIAKIEDVCGKKVECFAVETDEGNGVIHFIIKDVFLPRAFYAHHWAKIHRSYIVRFNEVKCSVSSYDSVAVYLATQCNIMNVWHSPFWCRYII